MTAQDQWSRWVLETRFGGSADTASVMLAGLHLVRDRVLKNAAVQPGDTLLDVGCGDGLIAFGALERVGAAGRVIFSDISQPLLDHCQALAESAGALARCQFVEAGAEDLRGVADASIDAVTTRSVLIYVSDKRAAFREFFRVLRPGGRLSIFEPINRFAETYAAEQGWWGLAGTPVADLAARLHGHYRDLQPLDSDPMLDFDQHDLLRLAEDAGFRECHLAYDVRSVPSPPGNWQQVISAPGNPRIPSLAEAMDALFTPEEKARFEAHVRPLVERGGQRTRRRTRRRTRIAVAYLDARKGDV